MSHVAMCLIDALWGLPRYGYSAEMSRRLDALYRECRSELLTPTIVTQDLMLVDHRSEKIEISLAGQRFALTDELAGILADALDDAVIARNESAEA